MFHMLTCFDLRSEYTIDEFQQALAEFTAQLKSHDLVCACGPIGRRRRHPVMDTDTERNHEYFFIMSFMNHAQCDRAIEHVRPDHGPGDSLHSTTYSKIENAIFICWEDIADE